MHWHELSDLQKRQYIDAESVFMALRDAEKTAQTVRGSMLWRQVSGKTYLIRTNADNSQKSLGPRNADTEAMYDKFMARKKLSSERVAGLRQALQLHQKLNRAHRVGRTPEIVVQILNQLHKSGIGEHFLTVGTHALFAFESACGVRFADEATTTQDIDLLMDTQKHLLLVIRRVAKDRDPHPLQVTSAERDFWVVQVGNGAQMASAARFSQMVVSASGRMALMGTLHPMAFSRLKQALANSPTRDPLKKSRDALQAQAVVQLVEEMLPHLLAPRIDNPAHPAS